MRFQDPALRMFSPKRTSPKKKKKGLFGRGKTKSKDIKDDDSDHNIAAPGAHYNTTGYEDDDSYYSYKESDYDSDRGRGRNKGRGLSQDRSRSRSVSQRLGHLMGSKRRIQKEDYDNAYSPPSGNIEMPFDSPVTEGGKRKKKVVRVVKKKKLKVPKNPDFDGSVDFDDEDYSPKKSKKKKKKSPLEAALARDLAAMAIEDEEILSATTGKSKKKKKKQPSISLLDDDDPEFVSPGSQSSKKKKVKKASERSARKLPGIDIDEEFSGKKKKKAKKSEAEMIAEAKKMRKNINNEMKEAVKHRESRAMMVQQMKNRLPEPLDYKSDSDSMHEVPSRKASKGSGGSESGDDTIGDWPEPSRMSSRSGSRSLRNFPTQDTEFAVKKKSLEDFDEFAKSWNDKLKLEKDEDETVMSMAETVQSMSKQLEKQQQETRELNKQLAESLKRIAELNEECRKEQSEAAKATKDLIDVRVEMNKVAEERNSIQDMLDQSEKKVLLKDKRIESLETAVEIQLDKVDMLEEKLEKTEEELFKLEEEITTLEEKSIVGTSDNSKSRSERMDSLRQERKERMESFLQDKKDPLLGGSVHVSSRPSATHHGELDQREKQLDERERELNERGLQMDKDRDYDLEREKRLDEWEHELEEKAKKLSDLSSNGLSRDSGEKHLELDELRRNLEKDRAAFEVEKQNFKASKKEFEEEQRKSEGSSQSEGADPEKVQQLQEVITNLAEEISFLKDQNEKLKSKKSKMAAGRDEMAQKLDTLEDENKSLTDRLEKLHLEVEEKVAHPVSESQEIADLRATVAELKEVLEETDEGSNISTLLAKINDLKQQNSRVTYLQSELARATDTIVEKDMQFKSLRNDKIKELEEEIETLRGELEAGSNVGNLRKEIRSLRAEVKDLRKKLRVEQKETDKKLERKDEAIVFMQNEMMRIKKDLEKAEKLLKKGGNGVVSSTDHNAQKQIDDLEDEIAHWKSVNADLEEEVRTLKLAATEEQPKKLPFKFERSSSDSLDLEDDFDADERSLGSAHTFGSRDNHSVSSVHKKDLFFVSDKTNAGAINAADDDGKTPSQRLGRSLATLWGNISSPNPEQPKKPVGGLYSRNRDDDFD